MAQDLIQELVGEFTGELHQLLLGGFAAGPETDTQALITGTSKEDVTTIDEQVRRAEHGVGRVDGLIDFKANLTRPRFELELSVRRRGFRHAICSHPK